ncbi:MAG: hypothetical protein EXR49_05415 [Dehalococcoidia bacterium]|nr:hypothetical protein [Dehalococcoidia bacterium]
MRWVTLTTAPNEPLGESWAHLLRQHGVCAYVAPDTITALIAGQARIVQIRVPEEQAARAKELLIGPWEWPEGAGAS